MTQPPGADNGLTTFDVTHRNRPGNAAPARITNDPTHGRVTATRASRFTQNRRRYIPACSLAYHPPAGFPDSSITAACPASIPLFNA